ncbi:MAG: glutamate-ammonia-ligase adenylyltransferase [Spongiibacter sp.]|nr:glutamate-ammonia-ligase adenylyltransferase [Spongiibacter sp.]|tara:strand:- start:1763 stop:2167 length:405 start_codon:yes stop_codon:yes gene_type:complete
MKIYAFFIAALALTVMVNIFYEPSEVRALNAVLKQDDKLNSYPYRFRVLAVKNGVAVMTSPRSADVPVPVIIKVIDPSLQNVSVSEERFFEAQQILADLQAYAREQVMAQEGISRVIWKLDEEWLLSHGVKLPH